MSSQIAQRFTIIIILATAVAISAGFNIIQFQMSKSAQDNIAKLQNENSQLREQLIAAKDIDSSTSDSADQNDEEEVQQSPASFSDASNNSSFARSITAVAVKATATTDGFFQTVRYEGSPMSLP